MQQSKEAQDRAALLLDYCSAQGSMVMLPLGAVARKTLCLHGFWDFLVSFFKTAFFSIGLTFLTHFKGAATVFGGVAGWHAWCGETTKSMKNKKTSWTLLFSGFLFVVCRVLSQAWQTAHTFITPHAVVKERKATSLNLTTFGDD